MRDVKISRAFSLSRIHISAELGAETAYVSQTPLAVMLTVVAVIQSTLAVMLIILAVMQATLAVM
jgi:hypothetical protein